MIFPILQILTVSPKRKNIYKSVIRTKLFSNKNRTDKSSNICLRANPANETELSELEKEREGEGEREEETQTERVRKGESE